VLAVDDVLCRELVPEKGYHMWRVRRAQHLIQYFIKTLKLLPKALEWVLFGLMSLSGVPSQIKL
jgi:hypothetical protein